MSAEKVPTNCTSLVDVYFENSNTTQCCMCTHTLWLASPMLTAQLRDSFIKGLIYFG